MFNDDRVLEDLKALNILDIASDLGRHVDRRNLIHCTFHDENTPSLKLYPTKGTFKCFGCGQHGSTIDLYMSTGLSFPDAVKEMKSRYLGIVDGQAGPPRRLARPVVVKEKSSAIPAEEFSHIYEALQNFCRQYPATDIKRQALAYLTSRAFSLETIKHFGLFVIPEVKATSDFLESTFDRGLLEASGLFSPKTEKSKGGFMFYKHPIIIPYLTAGRIINLQGRCIGSPGDGGWKYQYLRERLPITMFNGDVLRDLPAGSKVYLTEGAFDAMAVTQKKGIAVSINSATLFQAEWVKLFKGLNVCFFLDSDKAGQAAIEKLKPMFKSEGIRTSTKLLPADCKDVNEWLINWAGHVNEYPAFWDKEPLPAK